MRTDERLGVSSELMYEGDKAFSPTTIKNYCAAFTSTFACQGLAYTMFASFLTFVYTEYLGVGAATIGGVMAIGVFVDMATDIIMGIVCDRFHTKHGKAKHWFFWMAFPVAVTIGLMWMVPVSASTALKVIWAAVIYNLYCTFLTTVRLPAFMFPSIVSDNSKVRMIVIWIASYAVNIGATVTGWIITPVIKAFDTELAGYRALAWILAGTTVVFIILTGILLTEKRKGVDLERIEAERKAMKGTEKSIGLAEQFSSLVCNKYWVGYQAAGLFNSLSLGLTIGSMAYFAQYILGGMENIGMLITVMNIPMMVAPLIILGVVKFFDGKAIAVCCCVGGAIFSLLMWAFGVNTMIIFIVLMVIRQSFGSCLNGSQAVLLTRAIDYGEWKFGVRQEGLGSSFAGAFQKITMGISSAVLGFVLSAAGYSGGSVNEQAAGAIKFLFLGMPGLCMVVATLIFIFFTMNNKDWTKIREELDARALKDAADRAARTPAE
ncbi:MAG: MFS transporter [Treponema sp.]|nr:MFS transporter [Treponema sp.]